MAETSAEGGAFRDEPEEAEVVSRELLHEGFVWNLVSERFRYGDDELVREFVDHTGAVAILALDEDDRALFIRQYRHPVRRREWELPAGLLDEPGESALDAARRELAEETDLAARDWSTLLDIVTSPGGSNESIRIFLARGLSATDGPFARVAEEADMEVRWVPLDEALDAVIAGRIANATAAVGVLAAAHGRARGWATLRAADAPWPSRPPGPARS